MIARAHFRFLDLTVEMAERLQDQIPKTEIDTHYKTGSLVGSIELTKPTVVAKIGEFVKSNSIRPIDCDVFVSIASEKRDEVWRASKTVNDIVNTVNCPIVFSYTC